MATIKVFFLSMVVFAFLDAIWLGYVATNWYKVWLGPLARLSPTGSISPNWIPAVFVYVLLAAAVTFFVLPKVSGASLPMVFATGAFLGLIMYGVYDLSNAATLVRWPGALIFADMVWGAFATGTTALVAMHLGRLLKWVA